MVGSRLARYSGRVERWRADFRWRVTSRALSIARWGHNSTIATSPAPSLRFRTSGFPQYGSKSRRVPVSRALPDRPPRSSAKSASPRWMSSLTRPALPVDPPADTAGILNQPASGHDSNHLDPRALRSGGVLVSPPSSLLRPDPPDSVAPPDFPRSVVIPAALPDDLVWAAAESFPALGQSSVHACHHLYAGRRDRGHIPTQPLHPGPSSEPNGVGSSIAPDIGFRRAKVSALRPVFALCYGPRACSPSGTDPTSRARALGPPRTFTRASSRGGRPLRESGSATRHPGRIP